MPDLREGEVIAKGRHPPWDGKAQGPFDPPGDMLDQRRLARIFTSDQYQSQGLFPWAAALPRKKSVHMDLTRDILRHSEVALRLLQNGLVPVHPLHDAAGLDDVSVVLDVGRRGRRLAWEERPGV
jgi:hypothetical protein